MNHVNYLRAGPAEMPFRKWYTINTNHFRQIDFCQAEIKNTTGLSNNSAPHNHVRRIRFWRIKCFEQDFKYLYWTISKMNFWNLLTCNPLNTTFDSKIPNPARPDKRRLKNIDLVLFNNFSLWSLSLTQNRQKCAEQFGIVQNKISRGIVARARWCAQTTCSAPKR